MNTAMLMLAQTGSSAIGTLVFPLAILAIFYFILIVPQRRQLKEHQNLVSALQKGDQVVTAGGLIGEITGIKDDAVQLRTGTSTVVVEKSRIVKRTGGPGVEKPAAEK
ncbi:preprotein translocase subunit YajC [Longimicrobium sp.]|uniref:preprotein translocase subunit YajC n=1 Tax=Longimicrobium sp. TaxID=2029185 RepID=UPI002C69B79E|nr:preprotein translocase subunit YajC [Longimicrobium sp.]HSU16708.1 preprotein translocase subunit YajC [Longimicrobium sp.]